LTKDELVFCVNGIMNECAIASHPVILIGYSSGYSLRVTVNGLDQNNNKSSVLYFLSSVSGNLPH